MTVTNTKSGVKIVATSSDLYIFLPRSRSGNRFNAGGPVSD
jgi:hypothetical protein